MRLFLLPVAFLCAALTAAAAEPAAPLTPEALAERLTDLGYEPKDVSAKKNKEVWQVVTERDNWKVYINVSLSTDRKYLWLELKTAPLTGPDQAPADVWLRLLELSYAHFPAQFSYTKEDKRIHLWKPVLNHNLTPAKLRAEIDAFDAVARKTVDAWNPKNFAAPAAPAPAVKTAAAVYTSPGAMKRSPI